MEMVVGAIMTTLMKAVYVIMLDKPVVHSSGYINKNMSVTGKELEILKTFMINHHYPKVNTKDD